MTKPPLHLLVPLLLMLHAFAPCAAGDDAAGDAQPDQEPATRFVARDRFVVYLFAGHSNMAGRAKKQVTFASPRAWMYDFRAKPARWVPATHGLNPDKYQRGRFGPQVPFLKTICEAYPEHTFGLISNASTGQSFRDYRRGKPAYRQLLKAARDIQPNVTLGGVVVQLGYREAGSPDEARKVAQQAAAMVRELREDLGMPQLPVLLTQFETGAKKKGPAWKTVVKQIDAAAEQLDHVVTISTQGMTYADTHHFDRAGQLKWAARARDAINAHDWVSAVTAANDSAAGVMLSDRAVQPVSREVVATVEARIVRVSPRLTPEQIKPYKHALTCTEWEITKQTKGEAKLATRLVTMAHLIRDSQPTAFADAKPGDRFTLELIDWQAMSELHDLRVSDAIVELEAPLYYVKSAQPLKTR